jgi:hypothetical protein
VLKIQEIVKFMSLKSKEYSKTWKKLGVITQIIHHTSPVAQP